MKKFFLDIHEKINILSKNKRTSLLLCALLGAVGALPYFVEELFILTFASLTGLFYVVILRSEESKSRFIPFFAYFIGFYFPLYSFLSELYPYDQFGFDEKQSVFILICSCILIPLLHASVSGAIMMISKLFPKNAVSAIGFAPLWVINEFTLSLGKLAFPWGNISVSMTGFLPYLQTASLFGKYFITFITVSACFGFAFAMARKCKISALVGAALIVLNTAVGSVLYFLPTEKGDSVKAAAIQGNALSNEKWETVNRNDIFKRYINMTEDAAKNGAKLIILPESAFPQSFLKDGMLHRRLSEIATNYDVTIISGVHYLDDEGEHLEEYNSCLAILPDGSISARYDKRHLVPFGEFIPFVDTLVELFPFIAEFNQSSSEFNEGVEAVIIDSDYGKVAPLVCFDSIFPQFSREGVSEGAEFIAIVTNDSWFNDSVGVYTHLRHSQVRAIENRRYILRAANTGVSAFINEKGKIIECSEPLLQDTVFASVYSIEYKTLYCKIGDVFVWISYLTVASFIGFAIYKKAKK